jgi:parallel beta-helix repeat protein
MTTVPGSTSYRSIQAAIDAAAPGDVITLQPGHYAGGANQNIRMGGKSVTLASIDPNDSRIVAGTVIGGTDAGPVVSLTSGENAGCVLAGLTISGAGTGVYCAGASPTIRNCRIVGNGGAGLELYSQARPVIRNCIIAGNRGAGIAMDPPFGRPGGHGNCPGIINGTIVENLGYGIKGGSPTIVNSIVYFNGAATGGRQIDSPAPIITYSDVQGNWPGNGNLDADPCFVRRGSWGGPDGAVWVSGDYHLQSQAGRWDADAQEWMVDVTTSPCIDAGDPAMGPGEEPAPNGGRINLGAYGAASEAGMSP